MVNRAQSLKLGQLLVEKGLLTESQLEVALAEQKKTKKLLGDILMRSGLVTDEGLARVLSEQSSVEYIKLRGISIPAEVIQLVPFKLALHYKMIPISVDADTMTLATSNPISVHTLDDLKLVLKKSIRLMVTSEKDISEAFKKFYGIGAETMEHAASASPQVHSIQAQETQQIDDSSTDATIIKFVNQILLEAYEQKASDIHIEPYEDRISVRYRIDGVLHETKVPDIIRDFRAAVISRIKIMSNLNISETRLPQDGRIRIRIEESEMDLRVSILPTPFGESVVIRLLSGNMDFGIENLGFLKRDLKTLEGMLRKPNGVLFVTGPTGSGKTTTLYGCLSKINTPEKKIITVEDPIEYRLKGITQIQVHPKIDLTFAQALRSILRHDPDVIMVGEVRDFETAEIAMRMALTGHLVFSTLHTNDAASAVTRLIDMGVEPFLIASAVQCFIAQRLVRTICTQCKKPCQPHSDVMKEFQVEALSASKVQFFEGAGCDNCRMTGFQGRTAIHEILPVRSSIKELILQRASADKIQAEAMRAGMRTLRQDGWEKVLLGVTTPAEVINVTQTEDISD